MTFINIILYCISSSLLLLSLPLSVVIRGAKVKLPTCLSPVNCAFFLWDYYYSSHTRSVLRASDVLAAIPVYFKIVFPLSNLHSFLSGLVPTDRRFNTISHHSLAFDIFSLDTVTSVQQAAEKRFLLSLRLN